MANYSHDFRGLWSLARHKLLRFSLENQRLALGVSGGADSIGLLHVFSSFFKQKIIFDLVIFHINFGLRGTESDGDELFVRSICEQEELKLISRKAKLDANLGVQEAARMVRQEIQQELSAQGFTVVLAHNADDVAENILMRLARGSAVENAAGMSYFDGQIFRPWLDVSRETIRDCLKDAGISWRDDSSNYKNIYSRNRIRNEVMPILNSIYPGAAVRMAHSFLDAVPTSRDAKNQVPATSRPMAEFALVSQLALGQALHEFFTANYGGRSPVQRQVIDQIASAIHKVSTGLDGQRREFHLPESKILIISQKEIRLTDGK